MLYSDTHMAISSLCVVVEILGKHGSYHHHLLWYTPVFTLMCFQVAVVCAWGDVVVSGRMCIAVVVALVQCFSLISG